MICAEATLLEWSAASGVRAPVIVTGNRPPSRAVTWAPMSSSGSVTRAIGRRLSDSSPQNVAVTGSPATTPISKRTPVPLLPRSSGASGDIRPAVPTPVMVQPPSLSRVMPAPSACMARPVAITSSPSRSPVTRVVPIARPPRMKERCEIDLSPGTSNCPVRPLCWPDVRVSERVSMSSLDMDQTVSWQWRADPEPVIGGARRTDSILDRHEAISPASLGLR